MTKYTFQASTGFTSVGCANVYTEIIVAFCNNAKI